MTSIQPLAKKWNLKMLNCGILFPVYIRMISRSCVREKMPSFSNKKAVIQIEEKQYLPVETDTEKLAKYVCGSNLFIEGGEDVKLKEDSEYPSWLWNIGPPLPFDKLSPKTKTYWNRVRKMRENENKHLQSLQRNKSVHK